MPSKAYAIILALARKENGREFSGDVRARGMNERGEERKVEREWRWKTRKRWKSVSARRRDGKRRTRKSDGRIGRKQERGEPLYVTVVLAVRCGRSRRCLLIYWCDSFRRRAAFPKWCPRVHHGYLLTPRPRPHNQLPFHLRTKERERGKESRGVERRREERRGEERGALTPRTGRAVGLSHAR